MTDVEIIRFELLTYDHPLKTVSVVVSIVGAVLAVPPIYGIIWYEVNNHYRTLINHLVASICWYLIFYIVVVQYLAVLLYVRGSLSDLTCRLDGFFRNVAIIQVLFLLEAIVIFKFMFANLLRNPFDLQVSEMTVIEHGKALSGAQIIL